VFSVLEDFFSKRAKKGGIVLSPYAKVLRWTLFLKKKIRGIGKVFRQNYENYENILFLSTI
jgi:hypothetical protein